MPKRVKLRQDRAGSLRQKSEIPAFLFHLPRHGTRTYALRREVGGCPAWFNDYLSAPNIYTTPILYEQFSAD